MSYTPTLQLRTLAQLIEDFAGPLPEQIKMTNMIYSLANIAGGVTTVNGQNGDVVLTASDVGALPDTYEAPVLSVNGETGAVTLSAADVGAAADNATVNLTGDQSVAGVKTFTSPPAVPAAVANGDAANKEYVDSADSAYYTAAVSAMDARFTPAQRTAVNALTGSSTAADIVAALQA